MSPSAKGRFNKKIKTCDVQMIRGVALQRLFNECILPLAPELPRMLRRELWKTRV
jgi:hypothetical protein